MKILLTGGSGQVGTEFLRRAAGLQVSAPGRDVLDLARSDSVLSGLERERPDLILSVGAYTAVDRAEDEPELAEAVNAKAVEVLADYAREHDVPLLHLSTDYVFDGTQDSPYREQDPVAPLGAYGRSKYAGEQAARTTGKHLILRISWVFAAHGANFVRTMLRVGAERDELRVVDDQLGGPTWAGHVAQALRLLVDRIAAGEVLPWGTWHYGGAPHLSWHAFALEIFEQALQAGLITRKPEVAAITTAEYPTPAQRPANSRLDHRHTLDCLGLPVPDWREGLALSIQELAGRH